MKHMLTTCKNDGYDGLQPGSRQSPHLHIGVGVGVSLAPAALLFLGGAASPLKPTTPGEGVTNAVEEEAAGVFSSRP